MKHLLRTMTAVGLTVASASVSARAGNVVLSGPDSNDGSYSAAALSTAAVAGDTVSDPGTGLTGISLWGLLGGAGASSPTSAQYGAIMTSTPAGDNGKNAIFHYYLLGTNAAGAESIVSLGEIDPTFGGTAANPAFVAFKATGGALLRTPELVVPGAPGRDLTNLSSLQILSVPALATGAGGESGDVQLSGNVSKPGSYTVTQLKNDFIPAKVTVPSGDIYTGVPLWTFLDSSDSDVTDKIVTVQATDGYEVVLSLAELDPALGGNPNDLLPYADTGGNFPEDGVARIILPTDNKQGRWVSNVESVQVSSVPEPGSLTLLGVAAVPMTIAAGRRRRRVSA